MEFKSDYINLQEPFHPESLSYKWIPECCAFPETWEVYNKRKYIAYVYIRYYWASIFLVDEYGKEDREHPIFEEFDEERYDYLMPEEERLKDLQRFEKIIKKYLYVDLQRVY